MLRCEERLGCTEALVMYIFLDPERQKKVPSEFLEYLKAHEGPPIMSIAVPINVMKNGHFSKYGTVLVQKLFSYVK